MSIDPSIIGQLKPVGGGPTPFEQYGSLLQLQGLKQQLDTQRAQQDAAKKAQLDQQAISAAYQAALTPDGKFNRDILLQRVAQTAPEHVPAIQKELDAADAAALTREKTQADIKKLGLDATEAQTKIDATDLDYAGSLAQQVKAANYDPNVLGIAAAHATGHGLDIIHHLQQAFSAGQSPQQVVDATIAASIKQRELATSEMNAQTAAANAAKSATPKSETKPYLVNGKRTILREDDQGRLFTLGPNGQEVTAAEPIPTAAAEAAQAVAETGPATFTAERPDPKTANIVDRRLGYTPNAIYQNAITYALSGTLPTGSRSAATVPGQKAIQNKAAALASAAGVDQADLKREYAGATSATRQMMTRYQFTAASAQAAKDNIALAESLAKDVSRTDIPRVNRFTQWLTAETGGKSLPNLSAFEAAIYTAAREYAKVTSGAAGSVSGITDSASKQVDHLLNAAQAPEQFSAVARVMEKDMANFINPMKQQIDASKEVGPALKQFSDFLGRGVTSSTGGGADELPPAALFSGKPPGDYPATSPSGKQITVHWDGTKVTVR